MPNELTAFGLKCREYRTRFRLVMADQALGLGVSVSAISAIERGTRSIPHEYAENFAAWISLSDAETEELRALATGFTTAIQFIPADAERAVIAADLARQLNIVSIDHLRRLRTFLAATPPPKYSEEQIEACALLVRAVFKIGDDENIDIPGLIENHIALLDPDFTFCVDPDEMFRHDAQAIAYSDGNRVTRVSSSERLYQNRDGTHGREVLAHEIAHWILHRGKRGRDEYTFYQIRPGLVLSSTPIMEREADRFARALLMPKGLVQQFDSFQALARRTNVSDRLAKIRMRELNFLVRQDARERIRAGFEALISELSKTSRQSTPTQSLGTISNEQSSEPASARIIPFPQAANATLVPKAKGTRSRRQRRSPIELTGDLFEYADRVVSKANAGSSDRGSDWFDEFGWR